MKVSKKQQNNDFELLARQIETATDALRQDALVVINRSVTARAWLTGYYIVEYEQHGKDRAEYGESLLKRLVARLGAGYTVQALQSYRLIYKMFPSLRFPVVEYLNAQFGKYNSVICISECEDEKCKSLICNSLEKIGESPIPQSSDSFLVEFPDGSVTISPYALFNRTSYTHILQLLPLKDDLMRTFYAFEAIRGTWSVRELKRQIESQYFQRCGWAKDPHKYSAQIRGKSEKMSASDFFKTESVLEFLGAKLPPGWEESDLEQSICDNLRDFILEVGRGMCFEARQQKILIDDTYEKVDLVFYHRILKCHVLIELKPKKLRREDVVQLGVYMEYYRKRVMASDDNPPIGLLMCTEVGKETVEYMAPYIDERLFISKYQLELPSKEKVTAFLKQENKGRK